MVYSNFRLEGEETNLSPRRSHFDTHLKQFNTSLNIQDAFSRTLLKVVELF